METTNHTVDDQIQEVINDIQIKLSNFKLLADEFGKYLEQKETYYRTEFKKIQDDLLELETTNQPYKEEEKQEILDSIKQDIKKVDENFSSMLKAEALKRYKIQAPIIPKKAKVSTLETFISEDVKNKVSENWRAFKSKISSLLGRSKEIRSNDDSSVNSSMSSPTNSTSSACSEINLEGFAEKILVRDPASKTKSISKKLTVQFNNLNYLRRKQF
jgi:hypothetical protein